MYALIGYYCWINIHLLFIHDCLALQIRTFEEDYKKNVSLFLDYSGFI